MKICIIAHTERNYLPYLSRYETYFEKNNIEYDFIYWQREETDEPCPENEYRYTEIEKEGFFNKINSYIKFRKFAIKILRKNRAQYNKLLILTSVPAFFLGGYLKRNFKNKFIFDIRDYSFEKIGIYKKSIDKLVEASEFTCISSYGFMEFLEKNEKIVINHNMPLETVQGQAVSLAEKPIINIGYVGLVRYFDENVALISKMKNTFRYQLWYIGKMTENCNLEGFTKENEITNISYVGRFDNEQKMDLYKNIDIINSLYGNDNLEVTTLLPNRLYEAALLKKPILVSSKTFLAELVERYGLGIIVNVDDDDVLDIINKYVDSFDPEEFTSNCYDFLNDVKKDEDKLYKHLKDFTSVYKHKKKKKK